MRLVHVPPSKIGAPERGAIILPLRGPFITVPQHLAIDLTSSWESLKKDHLTKEYFDLTLGTTIYQPNGKGGIAIAGYLHDTSD